jgi:6-pyruvoyl-tetrahydropterin synthase
MPNSAIFVTHNIEVAHRLLNLPGKCQQIHGHSMIVECSIIGELNEHGILEGIDFGSLKKFFRSYLDSVYDHHLLLNEKDPWARGLMEQPAHENDASLGYRKLPGLVTFPGDPTTENIAKWICGYMWKAFDHGGDIGIKVVVQETGTNGAGYSIP